MAVYRLWDDSVTPASLAADDPFTGINLGTQFTVSRDGFITGLRYYRSPALASGVLASGALYTSASGTPLVSITHSGVAAGWNEHVLDTPIAVTTGVTYITAYRIPNAMYGATGGYFASSGRTSGPLTAPATGSVAGGNGLYKYGTAAKPDSSFGGGCYFADVVFADSTGVADYAAGFSDTQLGHFLG